MVTLIHFFLLEKRTWKIVLEVTTGDPMCSCLQAREQMSRGAVLLRPPTGLGHPRIMTVGEGALHGQHLLSAQQPHPEKGRDLCWKVSL